jgi:hypothetical protein
MHDVHDATDTVVLLNITEATTLPKDRLGFYELKYKIGWRNRLEFTAEKAWLAGHGMIKTMCMCS